MEEVQSSTSVAPEGPQANHVIWAVRYPENCMDDIGNEASQSNERDEERPFQPRVRVAGTMTWVPIAKYGQPYLQGSGQASHQVGPRYTSAPLKCDPENDMFVYDRVVLSAPVAPNGVHNAAGVDIFKDQGTQRGQKSRKAVEAFLLRPLNVAFNLNDPGSIFLYLDLLVRALRSPKDHVKELVSPKHGSRSVTFFSAPNQCSHKDCAAWRIAHKSQRGVGTNNVLEYPWWSFADFCLRDGNSIFFSASIHPQDFMVKENISPLDARQARAWSHALLNHIPDAISNLRTAFSIIYKEEKKMPEMKMKKKEKMAKEEPRELFPMLIDERGCMISARAQNYRQLSVVRHTIDPTVLPCPYCAQPGLAIDHYRLGTIPKASDSGLMYLHYKDYKGEVKASGNQEKGVDAGGESKEGKEDGNDGDTNNPDEELFVR